MNASVIAEAALPSRGIAAESDVEIPQYRLPAILGIWAAAALPMGALAWLVAPALADRFAGDGIVPMMKALLVCLTAGVVWQVVLAAILVGREQRTLRWSTVREALRLRSPRSPRSGRVGGRIWLIVIPLILVFAAAPELVPTFAAPEDREFVTLVESDAGKAFLDGAWAWYSVILALLVFTIVGEELVFRGFLLPRMQGVFGRADWVANGLLFTVYHLHVPWVMPSTLLDTFLIAYPAKRYRSTLIAMAVHGSQAVFFGILILTLVV